jgi:hypothetical protein
MKPKVTHVMINSGHRTSHSESASHYTVELHPEPWSRKVVNVQLIEAMFPKTQPCINDFCNVLQFRESGRSYLTGADITLEERDTVHTVVLPPGNYSAQDLIPVLNNGMIPREDGAHGTFRLRYNFDINSVTGGMTISTSPPPPYTTHQEAIDNLGFTNTVEFLFGSGEFRERSMHHILGFKHEDTGLFSTHVSHTHVNLSSSPFVDVVIDSVPTSATKMTQRRNPFTGEMTPVRVLARIPLQVPNYQLQYHKPEPYDLLTTSFYPVSIPSITIRLLDNRGNPYDTAGFDHYLTLAFTYLDPGPETPRLSRRKTAETLDSDPEPDQDADPEPKVDLPFDPKVAALVGVGAVALGYVVYRQFKPAAPPPLFVG